MSRSQDPSDAQLMRGVADGSEGALALLYRRFARPIFGLAVQTLDRAAAEDLVQDVFLAVWRNAGQFDPERGTVRAWLLQIAHFRLLNELRRQSRQPEIAPDPDGLMVGSVAARDPGPAERILASIVAPSSRRRWTSSRLRSARRSASPSSTISRTSRSRPSSACRSAPPRHASARASRRSALLTPLRVGAVAALGLLAALGIRSAESERARTLRSGAVHGDGERQREPPARPRGPGMPEETHARYRGRPGSGIAVVTFSTFPPAPGETYQAWVRHGSSGRHSARLAPMPQAALV